MSEEELNSLVEEYNKYIDIREKEAKGFFNELVIINKIIKREKKLVEKWYEEEREKLLNKAVNCMKKKVEEIKEN